MTAALLGARLLAIVLIAGCSATPGTPMPSAGGTAAPATSAPSNRAIATPTPTAVSAVRAPSGATTAAKLRGAIYLGFEACVALTPDASSTYLPPIGEDDFVLFFPKGWRVVTAHPNAPLYADDFKIVGPDDRVVARNGDTIEVNGTIRAVGATYCGFGWPVTVREVRLLGSASPAPS